MVLSHFRLESTMYMYVYTIPYSNWRAATPLLNPSFFFEPNVHVLVFEPKKNCYRLRYWALKRGEQKYRTYRAAAAAAVSEICFDYTTTATATNKTKTYNSQREKWAHMIERVFVFVFVCAYAKAKHSILSRIEFRIVSFTFICLAILFGISEIRFCDFGVQQLKWALYFHDGTPFCYTMQWNERKCIVKFALWLQIVAVIWNCTTNWKLCTLFWQCFSSTFCCGKFNACNFFPWANIKWTLRCILHIEKKEAFSRMCVLNSFFSLWIAK